MFATVECVYDETEGKFICPGEVTFDVIRSRKNRRSANRDTGLKMARSDGSQRVPGGVPSRTIGSSGLASPIALEEKVGAGSGVVKSRNVVSGETRTRSYMLLIGK